MAKGPIKEQRFSLRVVRRVVVIGLLALALIGGLILLGSFLAGQRAQRVEQQQAQWQAKASAWAEQLAASLAPVRRSVDRLAKDAAVRKALAAGDRERLAALAAQARKVVKPVPLLVRFFPPKSARADNSSSPPLTFASLEMIRAAETSTEPVRAEVHLSGSPGEHLVHVQRVEDEAGKLLGTVHVSSDLSLLRDAFADLSGIEGRLEVRQGAGSRTIPLASRGVSGGEAQEVLVGVPHSRWALAYSPSVAETRALAPWVLPLVAAAVLVLILLMLAKLWSGKRAPATSAAEIDYQGAIKGIADGAHPSLERLVPGMKGYRPPTPAAAPAAAPPGPAAAQLAAEEIDPSDLKASLAEGADLDLDFGDEQDAAGDTAAATQDTGAAGGLVPASIFRAYDIRGVVGKTLTEEGIYEIGRAIGSEALARGQQTLVVARDGRKSSPALADALINGLRDTGRDVIDIGMVPTPVLYFATHYLDTGSGVMVTGSHNPTDYNGLKIVLDGQTLSGEAITAIRKRIESEDLASGAGGLQSGDIATEYIRRIGEEVPVALGNPFKIVVDCANGVPGVLAPKLLRALGHDVIELYCDIDGDFPNHQPDPSQPENLRDLMQAVQKEGADLGLAFDGDGDRLGVVDTAGNIIWPDRQMMLFARDVLTRNPGAPIIFDVKCSRRLKLLIEKMGGQPLMWRTGHSLIKSKMQEVNAPLAGEMSGHIFFKERWYGFDDALYAAARLLEILNNQELSPTEVFAAVPTGEATPELRIDLPEAKHASAMKAFTAQAQAQFGDAQFTTIDGLRVDFTDGWGLLRPSNTTPCLVCRFEGDDAAALERVKDAFRGCIQSVLPDVKLPF